MSEIRVHDLPADVEALTAALIACDRLQVVSKSADYPDRRGASEKVRRYLDVRVRPAAEGEPAGGVLRELAETYRAWRLAGSRWRVAITDSESPDGIMPACDSPDHPEDDREQQEGVHDCCELGDIQTHDEGMARFLVAVLNAAPVLFGTGRQERAQVRS